MSETHPVAIFADQITSGMLIEQWYAGQPKGDRIRVAQVRRSTIDMGTMTLESVHILGEYEDGRPYAYQCGAQTAWLCHEARVAVE